MTEQPSHERPVDFYLRLANFMENAALKHPEGSPCWDRKMSLARRCRLKANQLLQMEKANA